MTKARQEATLKMIVRSVRKLLSQRDDDQVLVTGYEDEMGEDIGDLEESGEDS